jgi:RHS repeat-associated protein
MTAGTNALIFAYGANGHPMAVEYNGTSYYYVTNALGDVVAILDSTGAPVVEYTYDAWGRLLTTNGSMSGTLGLHNPLRYRGYVYDEETGLYYLQSRYYNPTICRFISADSISYLGADGTLTSYNLFVYCGNNPVNKIDPNGQLPIAVMAVIAVVAIGIINNVINAVYYEFSDGNSDVTPEAYQDRWVSRWERLDYAKQETGEDHYNLNAWRFFGEYSIHAIGWYLTGWSYDKDLPLFPRLAGHFYSAEVEKDLWDGRWYVDWATVIWGIFGF